VRDFAYEPIPYSSKAPEVFDPVPCLIAADWHMRNPNKNQGLQNPKAVFRLINMGWLSLTDITRHFNPYNYVALVHCSGTTTTNPTSSDTRLSPYP